MAVARLAVIGCRLILVSDTPGHVMKVLVGCELSGVVRDAFIRAGQDAWSCDLEASIGERHYQCDVFEAIKATHWDLIILHPPCTHLAVCGNKHYAGTQERWSAIVWTMALFQTAQKVCNKIALENPVGVLSSSWRKPDQYIQPWQFGHGETKKTGLWLHGLPKHEPTDIVEGREQRIWKMPPSADRSKIRSRTYQGVADAMAEQWT